MPITTERDDVRRMFVSHATGVIAIDDLLTFLASYRVGEFRPYRLLVDARDATTSATTADIQKLAARLAGATVKEGRRGPFALVATDDAIYGMGRMYQTYCRGLQLGEVETFRTLEEAEQWLDERPSEGSGLTDGSGLKA